MPPAGTAERWGVVAQLVFALLTGAAGVWFLTQVHALPDLFMPLALGVVGGLLFWDARRWRAPTRLPVWSVGLALTWLARLATAWLKGSAVQTSQAVVAALLIGVAIYEVWKSVKPPRTQTSDDPSR